MADINTPQTDTPTISPANAGANARADAYLAAKATNEAVRQGTEAVQQGSRATTEAVRQGASVAADLTRQGAQAGVEVLRQVGGAATETVRRSTQAVAEGQRQIAQEAAQTFGDVSRRMAQAAQGTSEEMRRFAVLPHAAEGGLRDVQHAMAGLVEGVMQTNLRATQELFRLANPAAIIELQQRLARDYMDALMQGTATLVRAVRRTADETLHPLEAQIEQRQQAHQGQGYRSAAE